MNSPKPRSPFRPRTHRFALESRQLFDGAAVTEAAQHNDTHPDGSHGVAETLIRPVTVERAASAQPVTPKEVYVIDSHISNWQSLAKQLPENSKVVVINDVSSGLGQLNTALAGERGITAIHIISHGANDEITLGSDQITDKNVADWQSQLAELGEKLSPEGDILLYGCSVTGRDSLLLNKIATFTQADVAASDDATGSTDHGGNWVLESHTGEIETRTLTFDYDGILDNPELENTHGDLIVSEPTTLYPGGEKGQFSGWTLTSDDPSRVFVVNVYLDDHDTGTLSNGAQSGTLLTFGGSATEVQNWLNQITFTASNIELGNQTRTTDASVYVFGDNGGMQYVRQGIIITPANDPATINNGSQTVPERGSGGTVIDKNILSVIDPDLTAGAQTPAQMVYSLTALPVYGYLTLNGQRLGAGSVFTQQDVNQGNLRYFHTATGLDQNQTDSFSAQVNDGATPVNLSASFTYSLVIKPENQLPSVSGRGTVLEGQPQNSIVDSIVGNYIEANGGGDPQDLDLTLTITRLPDHGILYFNGQPVQVGTRFDYADRSLLTYANDGAENVAQDTFGIRVTDQGGGTGIPASSDGVVTLDINSINDDPLFDSNSTLQAIVDTGTGSVVLTPDMLNATDVDSTDSQVSFVVNTANMTHGYLTLNGLRLQNGDTFTVAAVKAGQIAYVQYRNTSAVGEQDSFDFQVIDHTLSVYWTQDGVIHSRPGGVYSGDTPQDILSRYRFTLSLTDNVANAAPGQVPTLDQPVTSVISPVFGTDVNDPNALSHGTLTEGGTLVLAGTGQISDANPGLSYVVPNVSPDEVVYTWQGMADLSTSLSLQKNVGGVWQTLGLLGTFTQADINNGLIRFAHDGGESFSFTGLFEVTAGKVTLDPNGDPVPVVWEPSVDIYVTPVNDLPTISGSSSNVLAEGDTLVITLDMLSARDPDDANSGSPWETSPALNGNPNYALNNDATGADALKLVFKTLPAGGTLQYFDGADWQDITAADINTLQLDASLLTNDATSRLRFVSDGSEVRSASFSVSAVDRWGAESATAASVGLIITNVNDAPQIAADPTQTDPSVPVDSPNMAGGLPANNPLTVTEGSYAKITDAMLQAYDPDSSAEQVQYTLNSTPAYGRLARSTDGVNFNVISTGSSFTQAEISAGYIYYLNNGVDRAVATDGFSFTLSDGNKEQTNNQFVINISPANDAPAVVYSGGAVNAGAGATGVGGFTVDDPDLDAGAGNVSDFLQTTVRLLHSDGSAFSRSEYSDVVLQVANVSGLSVTGGNGELLMLTGTAAQINSALAGLSISFASDRNAIYQLQVLTDDRLRDASGVLTGSANGGPVNQPAVPAFGTLPAPVDNREYNWYSDVVPANSGNLAASVALLRASSINDPGTLSAGNGKVVNEDLPTFIGGDFVVSDTESNAFGLPVTVTLSVAQGTLGIGGDGVQTEFNGVTVQGDDSGTLILTGQASAIQALLNDPVNGLTYLSALNANQDQNGAAAGDVTLTVNLDTQASDVGAASGVSPANVSIALVIQPVNDAPTVTAATGIINLDNDKAGGNSVPGFVVDDLDITLDGGIANGETDHLRVTVRVTQADGTPLPVGLYRDQQNSAITITSGNTASGVTVQQISQDGVNPPSNGVNAPIVIDGTRAQVQAFLDQLQVTMRGIAFDDADEYYRVEVIVDDRNRTASGALTGLANGGNNLNAAGDNISSAPATEIDPYAALPAGLAQNVASASRLVFQSNANDAAQITLGNTPSISRDEGSATITLPKITVSDVDAADGNLTATVKLPAGFVFVSGGTANDPSVMTLTGTLDQINNRLANLQVRLPDVAGVATAADWNGNFAVTVTVNDNANSGERPATLPADMNNAQSDPGKAEFADATSAAIMTTRQFTFTVNPVNDAPVATDTTAQLPAISEDALNSGIVGDSVAHLFGNKYTDGKDSIDNSTNGGSGGSQSDTFWGVAISQSAANARQGEWQYSVDNGNNWVAVGSRSDSNALFLNGAALLRFVPAQNFFGTPNTLGVRLVENNSYTDKTSSTVQPGNGVTSSASNNGGSSLIGSQVILLSTSVNNVNDSPTLNNAQWSFAEDGNTPQTLGSLLQNAYNDNLDNQSAIAGGGNASQPLNYVAVYGDTTDAARGHWEYFYNTQWNRLPADLTQDSALILDSTTQMRFVQTSDYNGAVSGGLQLRASDSRDPSLVGGNGVNTRVSLTSYAPNYSNSTNHWSDTAQLSVSITAVKDAVNDQVQVHAGNPLNITAEQLLANDSFENAGRTVTSVSQPSHGTLTFANGAMVYRPATGYVGQDTFTYTVTSGGVTEAATVTIDVTNIKPVAVSDSRTLAEDSPEITGNLLSNDSDADGDRLTLTTFSINGQSYAPGQILTLDNHRGTLLINSDGTYRYTPVSDWNGSISLTYTVSDGNLGGTASAEFVLTVSAVSDIQDDVYFAHAGNPITGDVLANDTFSNADRQITGVTNGAHGTVTITANNQVIYTPEPGFAGLDEYTYTVTSGGVTETATVYVQMLNQPPNTNNFFVTTPEDSAVQGNLLSGISDPDGDPIFIQEFTVGGQTYQAGQSVFLTGSGTLTMGRDGSYRFIPVSDWNGQAPTVGLIISDGYPGGTNHATLDITVTPVADIAGDFATVHAGKSVTIDALNNDSFEDPARLITGTGPSAHGTVQIVNNQLVYTASAGYVGTDSFTYTVTSGGVTEQATVNITVTNAVPVSTDLTLLTPEDTALSGNVVQLAFDADNDPLTLTGFTLNGTQYNAGQTATIEAGSLTMSSDGSWRFTPSADWNGSVPQATFTLSDGNTGGQVTSQLLITVVPVADVLDDLTTVHSDNFVDIPVLDNDSFTDKQIVSISAGIPVVNSIYSLSDQGGRVQVLSDNTVRYLPPAGFTGTDTFTYTVTSYAGVTETATVTILVTNAAPSAGNTAISTAEDTSILSQLDVTDPNGDVLQVVTFTVDNVNYDFSSGNTQTVNITGVGQLVMNRDLTYSFTPVSDWNGVVPPIAYTVSDGNAGGEVSGSLYIVVTPVSDVHNDSISLQAGTSDTRNLLVNDSFSNSDQRVTAVTQGQHGTVLINTDGTVTYTPASDYVGSDIYTYTVTSGGKQETATVFVTVTNSIPVAQPQPVNSGPEDAPLSGNVFDHISDADTTDTLKVVSWNLPGDTAPRPAGISIPIPGQGTFIINPDGSYLFTPTADWNGAVPVISFSVSDGHDGGSISSQLTLNITPVDDIAPDSVRVHSGTSVIIDVLKNDTFSNADKQIVSVANGTHGQVTIVNGKVVYVPTAGFVGTDTFSYTVISGGRQETALVTVEVWNTAPQSAPDFVSADEDHVVTGNVLANDSDLDGDQLKVVSFTVGSDLTVYQAGGAVTLAGMGTFVLQTNGTYTFRPVADWNGSLPDIRYTATDGNTNGESSNILRISLRPVQDARDDRVSTHSNVPVDTDVLANDSFSNSDKTVSAFSQPAHGTVLLVNGQLRYTPSAGYVGDDQYTYSVTSGGITETATVRIQVLNIAPVASPDISNITEDGAAFGNLLLNDSDPDGDTLSVTGYSVGGQTALAGVPLQILGVGAVQINANGDWLFVPVPDWNGDVPEITYTLTDGNDNGVRTQTLNIGVSAVTDAHQDQVYTHSGQPVNVDVLANDSFSNPDATLTGVTSPASGTVAIVNGLVVYTPRAGFVGYDSFEYTVTSGGIEESATVVVWVTNQQPVASDIHAAMNEDGGTLSGRLTVSDGDNDAVWLTSFSLAGDATQYQVPQFGSRTINVPGAGELTLTSDRQFIFRPLADWNGTLPVITWQVTDGNENGNTAGQLAIVINPVVDIADDRGTLLAGGSLTSNVLENDSFENPDRQITSVTQGQHGQVTLLANGQIRYVPDAGFIGTDRYTYTVTSHGVTETASVLVVVKPVQEVTVYESGLRNPASGNASVEGTFDVSSLDATRSLTINGQSFTLAQLQQLNNQHPLTLDIGGGALQLLGFSARDGASGTLAYRYIQHSAVDHHGASVVTVSFNVSVNGELAGRLTVNIVDDVPQAQPNEAEILQDRGQTSVSGNVFADDVMGADGPAAQGPVVGVMSQNTGRIGSINGVSAGAYGTLQLDAQGNWRYEINRGDPRVAALDFNASLRDVFVYTLEDGDGNTSRSTLTIVIHGVTAMPNVAKDDTWHDALFSRNETLQTPRPGFTPGLFILPMIHEIEDLEQKDVLRTTFRLSMLGYGPEYLQAPILEQGILSPRWIDSTRQTRDAATLQGNGLGQNLLWDAFSPFSLRQVEKREVLRGPEGEKAAPVREPVQQPENQAHDLQPLAAGHEPGSINLQRLTTSVHGARSLSAQLAALHRPASDHSIVLIPAAVAKQDK